MKLKVDAGFVSGASCGALSLPVTVFISSSGTVESIKEPAKEGRVVIGGSNGGLSDGGLDGGLESGGFDSGFEFRSQGFLLWDLSWVEPGIGG